MTEAPKTSPQPTQPSTWSARIWRFTPPVAGVLVGLVFVVAGLLKVFDPFSFYTQIRGYKLVGHTLSKLAAIGLPPVEVALGLAAMVGLLRRLSCAAITAMLLLFMAATAHAWITGSTDNCGCFGELIKRSPKATFIEDAVLLVLAVLGAFGRPHLESLRGRKILPWHKAVFVGVGCVAAAGFSLLSGSLTISASGKLRPGLNASQWTLKEIAVEGYKPKHPKINLERGTHILMFYSPLCRHCWMSVPKVQELKKLPNVATVVGVSHDAHPERLLSVFAQGMEERKADYPLMVMPAKEYQKLTRVVPRLVIVKTGVVRLVLPDIPPFEQLRRYLH